MKKHKILLFTICALILTAVMTVTLFAATKTEAERIIDRICETPPTISTDGSKIILPDSGNPDYRVTLYGTNNEAVIDKNGKITQPIVDKEVKLIYKVEKISDNTEFAFNLEKEAKIMIRGKNGKDGINAEPKVLPKLQEWYGLEGTVSLTRDSRIICTTDSAVEVAKTANEYYESILGYPLTVLKAQADVAKTGDIVLEFADRADLGKEGYAIDISDIITVTANIDQTKGLIFANTTIAQIISSNKTGTLPKGLVRDYPAYQVRSLMIDVARYYIPLDYLTEISKYMAYYKMSEVRIHINDNGGENSGAFRLQSEKYPLLNKELGENIYTKDAYRKYQKDMLKYGLTVVTEIDTPAHSVCFKDYARMIDWTHFDLNEGENYTYNLNLMSDLLSEYMDGPDPVFVNKDFHIGMDEYPVEWHDRFLVYMGDLAKIVKDKGYNPRVWGSSPKADFANKDTIKIDKNTPVNLWSSAQASYEDFVNSGYTCINNDGTTLYVVPGNFSKWFKDRLNLERLYTAFDVTNFGNPKYSSATPNIIGAEASIWNDISCGMTPFDLFQRMRDQIVLISEKSWFGENESGATYAEFSGRINTLGIKSPISNPLRFVTNDEVIANYNFDKDASDTTGKFDGQLNGAKVENGKAVFDGAGYLSLPMQSVGMTYTASFDINISKNTKANAKLFDGKDGTMYLNYNGTGKLAFVVRQNVLIFDYVLKTDCDYNIKLSCDRDNLRLYIGDMYVGTPIHQSKHIKPENVRATTFVLPTERIGEGLVGTLDNLKITSKNLNHDEVTGSDIFTFGNVSLGSKVTYSGNEPGINCTPDMVTDGKTERNGANKVSLNRKDNAYIEIDLGMICKVSEIKIYWINSPHKYDILVSTDGSVWETVASVTQGEKGKTYFDEVITLDAPTDARFVKMQQVKQFLNIGGNGEKRYYSGSMSEIEVFGLKENDNGIIKIAEDLLKNTPITDENRNFMRNFENSINLVKALRANSDTEKYGSANKLLSVEIEKLKAGNFTTNGFDNTNSTHIASAYVTEKLYQKNEILDNYKVESRVALYGIISTDANADYAKAVTDSMATLYNSLVPIPVDKSELKELVNNYKLPFDYIEAGYLEYAKAYNMAKTVFQNEKADNEAVVKATENLKSAIAKLQKKEVKIENSALNKPVEISRTEHPKFLPEYLTDGDKAKSVDHRLSLSGDVGEWFLVDLQKLSSIERIDFYWFNQPATYEIQVSDDKTTWTTVSTRADNAQQGGYVIEKIALENAVGRYVRIQVKKLFKAGSYYYAGSINEMEVYTKPVNENNLNLENELAKKYLPIDYTYESLNNYMTVRESILYRVMNETLTEDDKIYLCNELKNASKLLQKGEKKNVAQGGKVEVSGVEAGSLHEGYLVDGDIAQSQSHRLSLNRSDDAWFIIDLGRVYKLGGFELYCFGYPKSFKIEVSKDKLSWQTVYEEHNSNVGGKYKKLFYNFDEVISARYVRLQQIEMFTAPNNYNYSASFNEMRVFALDESAFKVNLQNRYDEVKNTDTSKYHSDCKAEFENALLDAKRVLDSKTATQEEVENAILNLKLHSNFEWTITESGHSFECSCGRHIDEKHDYEVTVKEPTLSENGEKRSTCKICGHEKVQILHKIVAKFESVYLNLEEDVNIVYIVRLGEGVTDPMMRFTLNGVTLEVKEYKTLPDGTLEFKFKSVTPECFGDNIEARLYAKDNGRQVMTQNSSVTIKDYCNKVCEKYATDTELVTLAKDILYYGAKSQIYKNYKTDSLVIDGERAYTDRTTIRNITGTPDKSLKWHGAGLILNNNMDIYFAFEAADTKNLTVTVTVNGRETTFTEKDFDKRSDGKYEVIFDGVLAYEFDSHITATFKRQGVQTGETLTYSVNSYVSEVVENLADTNLVNLVKSIANYGDSAKAYKAKLDKQ